MVDAEHRRLREDFVQGAVERLRRSEVAAEGLLDDHPRVPGAAGLRQALHYGRKQAGRNREIVQRPGGAAQSFLKALVSRGVVVVAANIPELSAEPGERVLIDAAVVRQAVACAFAQPVERPVRARHADDRHIQLAAAHERLQRGEYLLVGEIAGGTEEHKGIGAARLHQGWMWDTRTAFPASTHILPCPQGAALMR